MHCETLVVTEHPEQDDYHSTQNFGMDELRQSASGQSRMFGPCKLLQQIGEALIGKVWMAEQAQPVRRRVALRLVKSGRDDKQILALFESERQALAMMDHQNVARILDPEIRISHVRGSSPLQSEMPRSDF